MYHHHHVVYYIVVVISKHKFLIYKVKFKILLPKCVKFAFMPPFACSLKLSLVSKKHTLYIISLFFGVLLIF